MEQLEKAVTPIEIRTKTLNVDYADQAIATKQVNEYIRENYCPGEPMSLDVSLLGPNDRVRQKVQKYFQHAGWKVDRSDGGVYNEPSFTFQESVTG